jgi:transposase
MAWTAQHRRAADRRGLRYPSDLTDAEWALVLPLIRPAKHGGRPPTVDVREVLNAVLYVLSTGCQWRALPKDLPPKSTAWSYFSRWEWASASLAMPAIKVPRWRLPRLAQDH